MIKFVVTEGAGVPKALDASKAPDARGYAAKRLARCVLPKTMDDTYDIFISYSSLDSETVHAYVQALKDAGYRVWYDSEGLTGGDEFPEKIAKAISASRLFVFFSTKHSNASVWTKGEVALAIKNKKSILPVRLDDSEYDISYMLMLVSLHYIDSVYGKTPKSTQDLLDAVAKKLGSDDRASLPPRRCGHKRKSLWISGVLSVLFALGMMLCSGEFRINKSLSMFVSTMAAVACFAISAYIILGDTNWRRRPFAVNLFYLAGTIFFGSYAVSAFGLCFVGSKIVMLNAPSLLYAGFALFALNRLMAFKRYGYWLLWFCAAAFAIGSYVWLGVWIAPAVIAPAACICMLVLTVILRRRHDGCSFWECLS